MTRGVVERPIIFSGPTVLAILAGAKTKTRRVIRFRQVPNESDHHNVWFTGGEWQDGDEVIKCPYGRPGQRLWVREAFALEDASEYGLAAADPPEGPTRVEREGSDWERILIPRYRASQPDTLLMDDDGEPRTVWRPSIFMPRWASRITLGITGVRVERLQDITEVDAEAEGADAWLYGHGPITPGDGNWNERMYRDGFMHLWDSVNAKRGFGWDANPLVWVVEFEARP